MNQRDCTLAPSHHRFVAPAYTTRASGSLSAKWGNLGRDSDSLETIKTIGYASIIHNAPMSFGIDSVTMETRETLQSRLKVELGDFGAKVDALKQRAEKAEKSAVAQIKPQLDEASSKLAHAKERLTELAASSGDAWESLREGVHKSWDEMKHAFEKASQAFDEHAKKP